MHPIFERVMAGETVCRSEVNISNATTIIDWVRATDTHHTKDECRKGKDCVHAPGQFNIDWAATITEEAAFVCTCGEHGVDNPDEAAKVVSKFRAKWSGDRKRPAKVIK